MARRPHEEMSSRAACRRTRHSRDRGLDIPGGGGAILGAHMLVVLYLTECKQDPACGVCMRRQSLDPERADALCNSGIVQRVVRGGWHCVCICCCCRRGRGGRCRRRGNVCKRRADIVDNRLHLLVARSKPLHLCAPIAEAAQKTVFSARFAHKQRSDWAVAQRAEAHDGTELRGCTLAGAKNRWCLSARSLRVLVTLIVSTVPHLVIVAHVSARALSSSCSMYCPRTTSVERANHRPHNTWLESGVCGTVLRDDRGENRACLHT